MHVLDLRNIPPANVFIEIFGINLEKSEHACDSSNTGTRVAPVIALLVAALAEEGLAATVGLPLVVVARARVPAR